MNKHEAEYRNDVAASFNQLARACAHGARVHLACHGVSVILSHPYKANHNLRSVKHLLHSSRELDGADCSSGNYHRSPFACPEALPTTPVRLAPSLHHETLFWGAAMLDVKPEPTVAMLAASLLCAAGAQANDSSDQLIATIDEVTGSVFVDNGQSYLPAKAGTSLEAYDRVFVLEDGSAAFVFEDGCRVAVAGPATRTLGPETSCDSMQAAVPTSLDQVVTDAASSPQALTLERAGTSRLTEYQIGAGIFGAMTLGGVIWAATNDDDDNPSRPPQLSP